MICSSSGRVAKSTRLMGLTDEAGFVLGVGADPGADEPWRTEKPDVHPSSQARWAMARASLPVSNWLRMMRCSDTCCTRACCSRW